MTNAAAIGYMILAAKRVGWDKETIERMSQNMAVQMDMHTEKEAEEVYLKS